MKIGYQGIVGSNSEIAAKNIAKEIGIKDPEFIPLVSSKRVINKLKIGEIDYGVVAIKNTLGGTVSETFNAIKDEYLELISTDILQIHHCLFKKPEVDKSSISVIASHIQALLQTEENRMVKYPKCTELEIEDTAIAAKYLNEGKLDSNVAVLCRKEAGEYYNLEMIEENLEDRNDNYTEFRMYKMSDVDYTNSEKPSFLKRFRSFIVSDNIYGFLTELAISTAIFGLLLTLNFLTEKDYNLILLSLLFISSQIIYVFLSYTRNKFTHNSLTGFWKYYSLSDDRDNHKDQQIDTPRIVKIEEVDGELVFHGFICDKENLPFFESQKVLTSKPGKSKGTLVYWYGNPEEMHRKYNLGGIVELNWRTKHSAGIINKMSGSYTGYVTKDRGSLQYLRITEREYLAHKNHEFL